MQFSQSLQLFMLLKNVCMHGIGQLFTCMHDIGKLFASDRSLSCIVSRNACVQTCAWPAIWIGNPFRHSDPCPAHVFECSYRNILCNFQMWPSCAGRFRQQFWPSCDSTCVVAAELSSGRLLMACLKCVILGIIVQVTCLPTLLAASKIWTLTACFDDHASHCRQTISLFTRPVLSWLLFRIVFMKSKALKRSTKAVS